MRAEKDNLVKKSSASLGLSHNLTDISRYYNSNNNNNGLLFKVQLDYHSIGFQIFQGRHQTFLLFLRILLHKLVDVVKYKKHDCAEEENDIDESLVA